MLTNENLTAIEAKLKDAFLFRSDLHPSSIPELVQMARRYHQMIDAARAAGFQFQIEANDRMVLKPLVMGTAYADSAINSQCKEGGEG